MLAIVCPIESAIFGVSEYFEVINHFLKTVVNSQQLSTEIANSFFNWQV